MNFIAPAAFAFAATIPVVIVFYLLKRKRTVHVVPSTVLWQRFLAESQANAPFQKLKHNWLLVLQILLLFFAVFALTRPFFQGDLKEAAGLKIVIMDASASMQTEVDGQSRFARALEEADNLVSTLTDRDQMVIVYAGAATEVKQSPTHEKSSLRRALFELEPADTPTRLTEALRLAESLSQNRSDAEIHLFSDGAVGDLSEFESKGLNLKFHQVGEPTGNLGITTLDARTHPENPQLRAIFASVANYSEMPVQAGVELLFEGESKDVQMIDIPPGGVTPFVFSVEQERDGVFTVRINRDDGLAVDNEASVVSVLPRPIKALLVTAGNRFLEKAIRAAPQLQLAVANDVNTTETKPDIVILDGVVPSEWPANNVLSFRSAAPEWFDGVGTAEIPAIVDWRGTHSLLRFVNFEGVAIAESLSVKAPAWSVSLADSPKASLILAGERGRQRIVWVGFDTLQSNWPRSISFPIFISNVVDWLNPATANAGLLTVRAGSAFRMPLAKKAESVRVTDPSGKTVSLVLDEEGAEIVYGDTGQQGVYTLDIDGQKTAFAVNLLDESESDLTPRDIIKLGDYAAVEASAGIKGNREVWRWLAFAMFTVLLYEWWYYHKRTA